MAGLSETHVELGHWVEFCPSCPLMSEFQERHTMRGNRILVALATAGLGATVFGGVVFGGIASAETLAGCPTSESTPNCDVLPSNDTQGETVTPPAAGPELALTAPEEASGPSGTLPFTGADVVELSVIGLGAIGAGTIMVRRSRTRRVTE